MICTTEVLHVARSTYRDRCPASKHERQAACTEADRKCKDVRHQLECSLAPGVSALAHCSHEPVIYDPFNVRVGESQKVRQALVPSFEGPPIPSVLLEPGSSCLKQSGSAVPAFAAAPGSLQVWHDKHVQQVWRPDARGTHFSHAHRRAVTMITLLALQQGARLRVLSRKLGSRRRFQSVS